MNTTHLKMVKFFLLLTLAAFLSTGCGLFGGQNSNAKGLAAAKYANKYIGVPYVYGGHSPKGFDCSGLTSYVYAKQGVKLPRSSAKQAKVGKPVRRKNLKPGDLVFFTASKSHRVSHVGIYIGDNKFIHAPGSGKKVTRENLDSAYFKRNYHSARRVG